VEEKRLADELLLQSSAGRAFSKLRSFNRIFPWKQLEVANSKDALKVDTFCNVVNIKSIRHSTVQFFVYKLDALATVQSILFKC
jgi:hypothetical protein